MSTTRTIERTFPAVRTTEGGGFIVHRPFPTRLLMDFDPFLLLDEMGPIDYAPGIRIAASKPSPMRSRASSATRIRRVIRARCVPATCNG
jgi:hypothetical protein